MRGGALPLLAWGLINLVLLAINWIWEGTTIHVAEYSYTVVVVWLIAVVFWLLRREAVRKGEPELRQEPEALPRISFAAAGCGIAAGLILFGIVFGNFLVFIGGALLLLCLGRLGRELIWQQRTLGAVRRELRRR